MNEAQMTPAEVRQRYRDIGGELPSDYALARDYGDAVTGAAEHHRALGRVPTHNKTMAELSDEEFERLKAEVRRHG